MISDNFSKFKDKKILVFGDIMLDKYIYGTAKRLSPEAPVPVVLFQKEEYMPGGAANVAANLLSLGAYTYLFSSCASDENESKIIEKLQQYDLPAERRFSHFFCKSKKTTLKTRIIANNQQIVRIDDEDINPLDKQESKRIEDTIVEFIEKKRIEAIIFEDYAKGLFDNINLQRIIDSAKEHNIITAYDPHPSEKRNIQKMDILMPNKNEAYTLAGMSESKNSLYDVAVKLIEIYKPKDLVIKRGSEGMSLYFSNCRYDQPTIAKEVFDVSGAGDTAIAALVLSVISGFSVIDSMKIANTAAGIVVGKRGTSITTLDEILQRI